MLDLANEHLIYEVTGPGGRLVVALNVADSEVTVPMPQVLPGLAGEAAVTGDAAMGARVSVPPHGWAILGP